MYRHKGKTYLVEWNEDTPYDKHISVCMMFDIEKQEFTNKYWPNDDNAPTQTYYRQRSFTKQAMKYMADPLEVKPMALPSGALHYLDFDWKLQLNHEEKPYKPRPKEHILRTHELMNDGIHLKGYIKYNNNVILDVDVNPDDLIDFVDYKYTIEKYDDEEYNHITKIECY